MKQTLFTIPDDFFGVPVFGFGLLLLVWTIFGVVLMVTLVRRHGFNAEARGYIPLLLIVAAVIVFLMPSLVEGGGLPIRGYGVMFLLAVVSAVGLAVYRAPKLGINPEMILSLAFWMIAAGLLGARLFHVIEYWNISYRQLNPDGSLDVIATLKTVINVPKGGLVVYGSFFGGFAVFFWFVHKHKMPALAVADLIAPSGMLGLALGRIGCLLNGCCFGGLCELPWAIEFPQTSSAAGFTPPYERQLEHGWAFGLHIGADSDDRLVVRYVRPDSSAAKAGIRVGDRIESIDGKQFKQRLDEQGELVTVVDQLRDLFQRKTSLLLEIDGRRNFVFVRWSPLLVDDPQSLSPRERIERGFGVTFGAQDGAVVINSVDPKSAAAARGVEAGDRVKTLDKNAITSLARAEQLLTKKSTVEIQFVENPAPKTLDFSPPPRSPPLQPTQIYSAINAVILMLFFLAYSPFRRRDGEIFALWVTIYPVTRFLLEIIRTDEAAMFGTSLSISQIVSIILLVAVVGVWTIVLRQPRGKLWATSAHQNKPKTT